MGNLNITDLFIIITLGYHALSGVRAGIVKTLLDFASIMIGLYIAIQYFILPGEFLYNTFGFSKEIGNLVSFFGIWILSIKLLNIVTSLINTFNLLPRAGFISGLGGFSLGILKGTIYLLPILSPFLYVNPQLLFKSTFVQPLRPLIENILQIPIDTK